MSDLTYIQKYYIENKHRFQEYTSKYMLKQRIKKRLEKFNVILSNDELNKLVYYRQLHPYSNIKEYLHLKGYLV